MHGAWLLRGWMCENLLWTQRQAESSFAESFEMNLLCPFEKDCAAIYKSEALQLPLRRCPPLQTFLDSRSLGPLHQRALAGHLTAVHEDVGRLHEGLLRIGLAQTITQSVGKLSDLLLSSHSVASDLRGKCHAAAASVQLPAEDPMRDFARLFCQVYPQSRFLQFAGSEELEVYSLNLGLTASELLGGGESAAETARPLSIAWTLKADVDSEDKKKSEHSSSEPAAEGQQMIAKASDAVKSNENTDADRVGAATPGDYLTSAGLLLNREQQQADVAENSRSPQLTAEKLVIQQLQNELESQRLQHQLLLQHIATQQEQQRLI
ncbi:hypothetical protein Efla_000224 [Eimeria flavescens]